jgi:hypothetical protein
MFRIAEGQHLGKPDGSGTFTPGELVTPDELKGCDLKRLVEIGAIKPLGNSLHLVKAKVSEKELLEEIEELTETNSDQLDKIEIQEKTIKKLQAELAEKDQQIRDLTDLNQHHADKFGDLEGKMTELKLASELKDKQIAELQAKVQELEKTQPKKK